jgi:transposase-like protein
MTKLKTKRSFKVPFKLRVVDYANKVRNIRMTAKKYKINRKTVRNWKNQEEHLKGNIKLY